MLYFIDEDMLDDGVFAQVLERNFNLTHLRLPVSPSREAQEKQV